MPEVVLEWIDLSCPSLEGGRPANWLSGTDAIVKAARTDTTLLEPDRISGGWLRVDAPAGSPSALLALVVALSERGGLGRLAWVRIDLTHQAHGTDAAWIGPCLVPVRPQIRWREHASGRTDELTNDLAEG